MSQGSRGVFLLQAFEQAIDTAVTSGDATGRDTRAADSFIHHS